MMLHTEGRMTGRILLIEDEEAILYSLSELLEEEGFQVREAASLRTALEEKPEDFVLVLLDLGLPDGEGWSFLEKRLSTREEKRRMPPVIILTARNDEADIVRGLDMGADDYVTKPFGAAVLLSRIRAVLRRRENGVKEDSGERLICGNIVLDRERTTVFAGEREISLTAGEFRLLQYLMENRNRTITRIALLERFWDSEGDYVNDNTLSVTVKRLREKLGEDGRRSLQTVRGIGYRMEDSDDR